MAPLQPPVFKSLLASIVLTLLPAALGLQSSIDPVQAEPLDSVAELSEGTGKAIPPELQDMVETMDQSANSKRLKAFMKNFENSFTHGDGLSRRQLKQSIRNFWKDFDQLSYTTEIEAWKEINPGTYQTITRTEITGEQQIQGSVPQKLFATIRSEQTIQGNKIINQSILDERSQITSGSNPPTVRVNLPKTVQVGEDYFFDVIVDEPLGDRILLGAAIEETVTPEGHLNTSQFEIQSLTTGGLFKIGQAPDQATDQWISALLIQDGGMYMMSQRMSVVDATATAQAPTR